MRQGTGRWVTFVACLIVVAAPLATVAAQTLPVPVAPVEIQQLESDELAAGSGFGHVLEVEDGIAVIRAVVEDETGERLRHVMVYERHQGTWEHLQTIRPGNLEAGSGFGGEIAITDNLIAVAAPRMADERGPRPGSVFLYERDGIGFQFEDRITASDMDPRGQFGGGDLEFDEETLYVGTPGKNGVEKNQGAVYVFEQLDHSWREIDRIDPDQPRRRGLFGADLDIEGDMMAIGAARSGSYVHQPGLVHVYERTDGAWGHSATLAPPGERTGDQVGFGHAVDLEGDILAVGSWREEVEGDLSGAAHVFEHDTDGWTHVANLTNPAPGDGDLFGWTIELHGATLAVGAPLDDTVVGRDAGSVSVFHRAAEAWTYAGGIAPSNQSAGDAFGVIDGDGTTLLVGAPFADADGPGSGATYSFLQADARALPGTLQDAL